jgi:hypothetical protein
MKRFVIEIEYDRHLVQSRDEIVDNLESLYADFNDWLRDKSNDHGYWVATDGDPNDPKDSRYGAPRDPNGRDGLCFDADAFIKWLNENHSGEAEIVATEPAGIHHSQEFFEWAKANGYVDEESIEAQLRETASRFGVDVEGLRGKSMWYDDKLYPVFVKETGCVPEILRLVEEQGVKRVYF